MKRALGLLAISLLALSCATTQQSVSLVTRAVDAVGGPEPLAGVRTLSVKGTVRQWEPEQSAVAGGEMRFANEATFTAVTDVARQITRTDIVRTFAYPAPRTFTFTEIVTPDAGYVAGIDSNGRTKQSLESTPPAHSMSGLRLAASQRELRRGSSLLLLDMLRNPGQVTPAAAVTVAGVAHPAVDYRVGDQTFTVMFDPSTALPARIRTLDYDSVWGDVTFDLVLSDWRTMDGLRVATSRKYELNGRPVEEIRITESKVNAPVAADHLAIPPAFRTVASKPATGPVPYQWVLRRQFIGFYLDSDVPSYDTRASTGLRLVEVAPRTFHAVGGTHHSLVVEMRDSLVVFDAPVSDWQSKWLLTEAQTKFPGKRVKYLVLTHHHMDHTGGLRAYAAQGATLVVGQGTAAHYRRVLASPFTRNPDLASSDLSRTEIIEVTEKWSVGDGEREVQVYRVDNTHANGLLIGFLPEPRLGFVTDIWSPGTPLPATLNPNLAALIAGVKRAGIEPQKFVGGHGSAADYSTLTALEGKK